MDLGPESLHSFIQIKTEDNHCVSDEEEGESVDVTIGIVDEYGEQLEDNIVNGEEDVKVEIKEEDDLSWREDTEVTRTVARRGEDPKEDDTPTQLDSQNFERTVPPPCQNSTKRKRTYHIIPEDKEALVVEWYRDQKFLYNKKMRAYKNQERKAKAWKDKARSLNVEVSTLQTWIMNMHTRYAKLVQTKSGQGTKELTERDTWIKESFNFLRPHIVRCTTRTSKKSAGYMKPQTSQETQLGTGIRDKNESDSGSSQSRNLPPSESSAMSREKELLDKLAQAEERQQELMQAWTAKKDEVPVAVQMIKDVHQLISTTLGDIGVPLATVYVSEMVKYMLALIAYQNNTGLMPRVVVDLSSNLGPGTSSQVHETMLPLGNFPHSSRLSSAPSTPELGQQETDTRET